MPYSLQVDNNSSMDQPFNVSSPTRRMHNGKLRIRSKRSVNGTVCCKNGWIEDASAGSGMVAEPETTEANARTHAVEKTQQQQTMTTAVHSPITPVVII